MISFLKNTETKYDVYWDNFTIGQIVLDSSDKFWYFSRASMDMGRIA